MSAMVPGIYKQGSIKLLETPTGVREGRVRVLLIEEDELKPEPRYLVRGKYPGDTPPEAFKEAEFQGEPEFDDLYGR